MSRGAEILQALQARLQKITTDNGYGRTVKLVRLSRSGMDLNIPPQDCPIIEIYQDELRTEHGASSHLKIEMSILLLLVDKKDATDEDMEDFQADVRAVLYGDSPTAGGNAGITLGGKITKIQWEGTTYDLNLIQANRRCVMEWTITSHQTTYKI
jgi:hypothetical protein